MDARVPLPRELNALGFSVADALGAGVGRMRLRGRDLAAPFWGVRIVVNTSAELGPAAANGAPHAGSTVAAHQSAGPSLAAINEASVWSRAQVYSSRMPADAFYSHVTAALLWGIPLPWGLSIRPLLDVSVPGPRISSSFSVPAGKGVAGHRLQIESQDVVELSGIRVTSLARTWCDLGSILSEEDLVAAGDFLMWRKRPRHLRQTRKDLEDAIGRFRGRRGRPLLLVTLPFLSDRSDSRPESVIRVRAFHAGLPRPAVNPRLYDSKGRFLAMPDLAFLTYKIAFDYEGDHHRTDAAQWETDIARVPKFEDDDWLHVRGSKADFRDSTALMERFKRRLRSRGWNPGSS